jgi:hypothetical protein
MQQRMQRFTSTHARFDAKSQHMKLSGLDAMNPALQGLIQRTNTCSKQGKEPSHARCDAMNQSMLQAMQRTKPCMI